VVPPMESTRPPRREKVLRGVERVISVRTVSPRNRQVLLFAALIIFVLITALSFRSLPHDLHTRWWPVPLVLLVTTPMSVLLNAGEFRVMGAINGHAIRWGAAVRLTVVAGAANLLPLPGGVIIRTEALRQRGSTYKHALGANASAGIAWLGMGCVTIGMLFAVSPNRSLVGLTLIAAGTGCLMSVSAILRRIDRPGAYRNLTRLIIVETSTIIVGGSRLFLLFKVLGLTASVAQSITLTASQIIASAVGIVPAGLGLRELIAGGIGSLVALPAGAAVAVTAVDRIATQLVLGLLAAALLWRARRLLTTGSDDDVATPITQPTHTRSPGHAERSAGQDE
jgi:hypothetical protein